MKNKKQFIPWALLGLVLCMGALSATGLFKFTEWLRGVNASEAVWVRDAASQPDGHWTNALSGLLSISADEFNMTATDSSWKIMEGGGDSLNISNSSSGNWIELGVGQGARFRHGFETASNVYAGNVVVTNNFANIYSWDLIATNSTANSNLTMNFDVGARKLHLTNNISITNFTGQAEGYVKNVTWYLAPVGTARTVVWPTWGTGQFGIRGATNVNNTLWTTLTNPHTYRLTVQSWGTNVDFAISEWH